MASILIDLETSWMPIPRRGGRSRLPSGEVEAMRRGAMSLAGIRGRVTDAFMSYDLTIAPILV